MFLHLAKATSDEFCVGLRPPPTTYSIYNQRQCNKGRALVEIHSQMHAVARQTSDVFIVFMCMALYLGTAVQLCSCTVLLYMMCNCSVLLYLD